MVLHRLFVDELKIKPAQKHRGRSHISTTAICRKVSMATLTSWPKQVLGSTTYILPEKGSRSVMSCQPIFATVFRSLSIQRFGRNTSASSPKHSLSKWTMFMFVVTLEPAGRNWPASVERGAWRRLAACSAASPGRLADRSGGFL